VFFSLLHPKKTKQIMNSIIGGNNYPQQLLTQQQLQVARKSRRVENDSSTTEETTPAPLLSTSRDRTTISSSSNFRDKQTTTNGEQSNSPYPSSVTGDQNGSSAKSKTLRHYPNPTEDTISKSPMVNGGGGGGGRIDSVRAGPDPIVAMANLYDVDEIPASIASEDIVMLTVHLDISRGPTNPSTGEISFLLPFPNKNLPVKLICIGSRRWTVQGNVSLGLNFCSRMSSDPLIQPTVIMNGSPFLYTMMANGQYYQPECLFSLKPDQFVRKVFPSIKEHELDVNCINAPSIDGKEMVALPYELDKKNCPVCPVGYLAWYSLTQNKLSFQQEKFGKYHCLIMQRSVYLQTLEKFKQDLRDSRVLFRPMEDRLIVTSTSNAHFHASIVLDIFYCRA
jgi:hypothetical protein